MPVMSLSAGGPGGWYPVNHTIPAIGVQPYTMQKPAGMRIEPTRSDPSMIPPACRRRP